MTADGLFEAAGGVAVGGGAADGTATDGLDADGMRPVFLAVTLIAGLAGIWSTWLVAARVPVYEVSQAARLEVDRIHPVAAPVAGRVIGSSLALGREVRPGDVLLEICSGPTWLAGG